MKYFFYYLAWFLFYVTPYANEVTCKQWRHQRFDYSWRFVWLAEICEKKVLSLLRTIEEKIKYDGKFKQT